MMWTHVMNMGLDWPNLRLAIICSSLSLHIVYVLSLDLRLSHVLEMWINLLWGYQTLHRNWIVIKVDFGFVRKHAARHGQSRWDLPLSTWERYLWAPRVIGSRNAWSCYIWLRVNLVKGFRITVSRKRGQLGARPNIVRQRERHVLNLVMVRQNDLYMRLGVGTSC